MSPLHTATAASAQTPLLAPREDALLRLGLHLREAGYRFITPTPETQRRVLARDENARTLRDVFGWNRPFRPDAFPEWVAGLLRQAGALGDATDGLLRAEVRFSSLGGLLLAHGAYPTAQADAVFFGPDTYRYARLLEEELRQQPLPAGARVLDLGCGTGAGGLFCASISDAPLRLALSDINAAALRLAEVNALLNPVAIPDLFESDLFAAIPGEFDLVCANPPYLADALHRTYRDGGGPLGAALSVRIVRESLQRLAPGGRLVLYTGTAVVDGEDRFLAELTPELHRARVRYHYRELDPDVFGEELDRPPYDRADRIAVVALTAYAS